MTFNEAEEVWKIVSLLNRYALAYDTKDVEKLRMCYTENATFTINVPSRSSRTFQGIETILENAQRTFGAIDWPRKHIITNHVIQFTEAPLVQATCYLQLVDTFAAEPRVTLTGSYTDTIIHTTDGWRILRRTLYADSIFQIHRHESLR